MNSRIFFTWFWLVLALVSMIAGREVWAAMGIICSTIHAVSGREDE